jgi:HEAT repeat protein
MATSSAFAIDASAVIEKLNSEDYGERLGARMELQQRYAAVTAPNGDKAVRQSIQTEVIANLDDDLPVQSRLYLFRLLELYGSAESAEAVYPFLGSSDAKVRDGARRALSSIPGEAAADFLLTGLLQGEPAQRTAYVDALVSRGAQSAAPGIAELLASDQPELVRAAAIALGALGNTDVIPVLLEAHSRVSADSRQAVELALIDLGLDSNTGSLLVQEGSGVSVRFGAFKQLSALDEEQTLLVLSEILAGQAFEGKDRMLAAAMEQDYCSEFLVNKLPELDEANQFVIVSAIGSMGLSQYENELIAVSGNAGVDLRLALLETLSRIGSDASFDLIYSAFTANPQDRALEVAISLLVAPVADKKVLTLVQSEDYAVAVSALKILELRNTEGAVDVLNAIASGDRDPKIREAAFASLEVIGNLSSMQILADIIVNKEPLMRSAQRSLKRLTLNYGSGDYVWETVFEPTLALAADDSAREGLIVILDGVNSGKALDYLKGVLAEPNAPLRPAVFKVLARYSGMAVGHSWADIAALPNTTANEKAVALKALKKSISTGNGRDERDRMYLAAYTVEHVHDGDFRNEIFSIYSKPSPPQKRKLKAVFGKLEDHLVVGSAVNEFLSNL